MTDKFTLIIKGPKLNFEREIDGSLASRMLTIALTASPLSMDVELSSIGETAISSNLEAKQNSGTKASIGELITETRAKTNQQKILVIAKYIINHNGASHFTAKDIRLGFIQAREKLPGNFFRDLNQLIQTNWIAREHVGGKYYITRTGETALKNKFLKVGS